MYYNRVLRLTILFFISSVAALAQNNTDSIKIAAHPKYDHVTTARRLFFGRNYRKVWGLPTNLKVLRLSTEQGGLKVTETGGGNQTRSLHLVDSAGNKYALRSVEKFPERALPKDELHTAKKDILKDAVTTSNPYSALIVPPLAEALGIPHTNPQIVYVGDEEALGEYRKDFARKVYLFEQTEATGKKFIKTEKVEAKLLEDNDNKIDQKLLLRARLLDIIIGDWDRHADQWRWQKTDLEKGSLYVPIPQDRDKVFYSTSGVFPWFAARQKPQLQAYRNKIKNIGEWNLNNVFFDLQYLNQLSQADWEEQIAYLQSKLTDYILTEAVKLMPASVYNIVGKKTTATLITRRNNLKKSGLEYYRFLAKNVDIPASDKRDNFEIKKLQNGSIYVGVYKLKKDDTQGDTIYKRTFDPKTTKEIRLYGMDGKDRFTVTGSSSPIKIRMIGGKDQDSFTIDSGSIESRKLFIYDTSDDKNQLPATNSARIELSKDTNINKYDKNAFKYDLLLPKVGLGYNSEDGVRLQVGYGIERYGFRGEPYISKQDLTIGYTLSKQSFIFTYFGDFKHVIGKNSLLVNIISRGPRNVNSFFGYGNETPFPNTNDYNYYRNRYDYTVADVRIYQQLNKWRLSEGLVGQYYTSKAVDNASLFFNQYNQAHPAENLFSTKTYGGAVLGIEYDTRNSTIYPTKGVLFNTRLMGLGGLNLSGRTNAQLFSTFTFFLNPGNDSTFVIANKTGGGIFTGNGEFFQMMNLGGPFSLQGFHTSRFIGKQILFNDLEIRLKLFKFNTYLFPATLGLIAFNDTGRVWLPGENSDTIHNTYGGGLFITPYSKFILSAVMGHSSDSNLLYLATGFRF
jgi:hypothetical protein